MKFKHFTKLFLFVAVATICACSSSSDDSDGSSDVTSITITLSSSTVFQGESISFIVTNNLGTNITSTSQLRIGDDIIPNPYTFDTLGTFEVTATKGGLSNSITVTVQEVPEPTSLTLSTNNEAFWYDEGSAQFTVIDNFGNDVTSLVTFTAESGMLTNPATFASAGTYNVVANFMLEDGSMLASNSVEVNAVESTHTTKVMIEDYTGTWCQYCPRLAYALDQAVAANANIIPVAIHDDADMPFPNVNVLLNEFNVTGFPAGRVNRTINWNESTNQPVTLLGNRQNMGLAINSSLSGSTITAEVKVHYDLEVTDPNRIVVYLLENGLVYPQVNFYNGDPSSPFFQQGNPIPDYVHNHTARVAFTDLFGDVIPLAESGTGDTYTVNYTVNVPASVQNSANLELVAFVVGTDNKVLNVQKAALGEDKDFD